MRRRTATTTLLCAAVAAATGVRPALASELSPKQLAVMLLRILAYDRNVRARSNGKSAPIVVLYLEGNQGSEAMQGDVSNALDDLTSSVSVGGLRLQVSSIAYSSANDLDNKIAALRPVAIFVCTGLADSVPSISAVARRRSVLTMTMTTTYLKSGLSIGLSRGEDRLNILVNLPASRAEGADLDAALLRLAEVYR
jgi:hypothetical protein